MSKEYNKFQSRKFLLVCFVLLSNLAILVLKLITQEIYFSYGATAVGAFCAVDYFEKKKNDA